MLLQVFPFLTRLAFLFFKLSDRTDDLQRNRVETIASFAKQFGAAAGILIFWTSQAQVALYDAVRIMGKFRALKSNALLCLMPAVAYGVFIVRTCPL